MQIIFISLCFVFCLVDSERIKIHTMNPGEQRDFHYFPLNTNYLEFNIKTKTDAVIMLCNQYGYDGPLYEIFIGTNNNTFSLIRNNITGQYADTHTGAIFDGSYQRIGITINETEESISVGKGHNKPFLYLHDPNFIKMSIFGIASRRGSPAHWDFDLKMLNYSNCFT